MFTTFRFLTCFFELNYYAKVSHGKSNFEIIFFLVLLFVKLRQLLSETVLDFSSKFLLMVKK